MTYAESSELTQSADFRGRVKVACIKYADSIMIEASSVAGHTSRLRWAQSVFAQPDFIAAQVQPPTVMDPAVQAAGAAVEDAALQGAVEATVNKTI